jgi:predicted alpha/beta hydrolase family esterase
MQVILVGHDFGGACISYVMELFPSKISKAIFIAAAMLSSGQSTLDVFSQQVVLHLLSWAHKMGKNERIILDCYTIVVQLDDIAIKNKKPIFIVISSQLDDICRF